MDSNKTVNESFFQAVSSAISQTQSITRGSEEISRIANSLNSEGETPLILAIKDDNYNTVGWLVLNLNASINQLGRFIWKGVDLPQVPPLFAAIFCDLTDLAIINFLIGEDFYNNQYSSRIPGCLDVIMSSSHTPAMKRNVLKLLGAVYVLEGFGRQVSFEFALHFWSASVRLDTSPPTFHQVSEWAGKVFGDVSEFETLVELDEIRNRPESKDHLNTQALIIVHRVMSEICPYPCTYFSLSFLRFAKSLVTNQLYSRAIDVVMLSVESLRARDWIDAFDSEWPFKIVDDCLEKLRVCLFQQKKENLAIDSPNRLQFPLMMEAFRCFSSFHSKLLIHRGDRFHLLSRQIIEKMVKCMKVLPLLNPEESIVFKQWLSSYIALIECHPRVHTLLHYVCRCVASCLVDNDLIELLLSAGACPFAVDEDGNAPLHYLSLFFNKWGEFHGTPAQFLLNAGARLDQVNEEGVTPLENLKRLQSTLAQRNLPDPYLDSLCNPLSI